MELHEALAYLDRHINREAVAGRVAGLSLEPIRRLVHALGDPQDAFPAIHVTGTNGKGSTAAMAGALLAGHGLVVGSYTSPHVQRLNERIARNGGPVSDTELADAIGAVAGVAEVVGVEPSYFEILTAAALGWFAAVGVDAAVVEVGLLGRWDATNVVDGTVAVVTNVGKDHTDGGPGWREAVAAEKAGIIKASSAVVLGESDPDLRPVFAREPAASWAVLGEDVVVTRDRLAIGGRVVDVRTPRGELEELFVPLHGAHQALNAALAVAAVEAFFDRPLDADVAREALAGVRLPGRLEVVRRDPLVLLDAAHNPDGARAATAALEGFAHERRVVVVGLLEGRDPDEMAEALGLSGEDAVVCCRPRWPRAMDPARLADAARRRGATAEVAEDPRTAVDRGIALAGERDLVLVTGSLYVVGDARGVLVGTDAASTDAAELP